MKGPWMDKPEKETNYKYNGIEKEDHHGLNINLAHYRTLDPAVGQWRQVDPKTENFSGMSPYCSMGNNPISIIDPAGDEIITAMLVGAAVGVLSNGVSNSTQGNSFFNGWGQAALTGAFGGAISGGSLGLVEGMVKAGASVASSYIPGVDISVGSFNLNLSPGLMFAGGGQGWNVGVNATFSGKVGKVNFALGGGLGGGVSEFTGNKGLNYTFFGAAGVDAFMLSSRFYKAQGLRMQQMGGINLRAGDFSFSYENDGAPFPRGLSDGEDSFRTAAFSAGYNGVSLTANIFTGQRDFSRGIGEPGETVLGKNAHDYLHATLSLRANNWRVGINDYRLGHGLQNILAHKWLKPQAFFNWNNSPNRPVWKQYSGYYSANPFTNW